MEKNRPIRLLISSFDYRPRAGGLATLTYETAKALNASNLATVKLLCPKIPAGDTFDKTSGIQTKRIFLPRAALAACTPLATALYKEVLSWRPDAILNIIWMPDGVSSLMTTPLLQYRGIPYFVMAAGVELLETQSTYRKRLRRFILEPVKKAVLRNATKVFPISHYTQRVLVEKCDVPIEKTQIIYPGVDPDSFKKKRKLQSLIERYQLQDHRVLLSICRLSSHKGLDFSIQAFSQICKKYSDVKYLICGEGSDLDRLKRLTGDLQLSERVIFVGPIQDEELADYYNLADCFIQLSREDLTTPNVEGFGITFLEASACEIPVIAGRSGGVSDSVEDQVSGFLVTPDHVAEITSAMVKIFSDPSRATQMGLQGRQRVLQGFTWNHTARTLLGAVRSHV